VDDEDVVRRVTATALRRFGHTVVDARTGDEGARLARERAGQLDLLLTDMVMSEVSGVEVAAVFRTHNPECPVIFTSGYSDEDTRDRVESEGAGFLIKPYDIGELGAAVMSALGLAQTREWAREKKG
jgi:two-component system cell cycle sensor histidine kinase/response regulator CckA